MKIKITLSANAGAAVHLGGKRIWVDALHDRKQPSFSTVDIPLQQEMYHCEAFAAPDYICYTHCHGDHFSEPLTAAAKRLWPKARIVLPEMVFEEQILVTGENFVISDYDLCMRFFRLPHEGEQYRDVVHYGILISCAGKNILLPGDCQVASPELGELISSTRIDLALLNFPWITLSRGKRFLQEYLSGAQLAVYHLPFARDDISHYRAAVDRAVRSVPERNVWILQEPLQRLELDI